MLESQGCSAVGGAAAAQASRSGQRLQTALAGQYTVKSIAVQSPVTAVTAILEVCFCFLWGGGAGPQSGQVGAYLTRTPSRSAQASRGNPRVRSWWEGLGRDRPWRAVGGDGRRSQ